MMVIRMVVTYPGWLVKCSVDPWLIIRDRSISMLIHAMLIVEYAKNGWRKIFQINDILSYFK